MVQRMRSNIISWIEGCFVLLSSLVGWGGPSSSNDYFPNLPLVCPPQSRNQIEFVWGERSQRIINK